jgi:hypothetical protein
VHHCRGDPGPGIVVRLAFRDAAGQGLGLSDNCWDDGVGMLGDGSKNLGLGGCDLFGCFLGYGQLM